jgi:hypothetical protein
MSRKRKNTYKNGKPDLLKSLASLDFNELDRLSKTVPMLLQSKLQSSMMSRDVEDVMKANLYLGSKTSDNGKLQSVFFDPQVWNDSGRDYLAQRGILPFSTLRRMGGIYLVRAIVNTRIEQIQNFLHFSDDEQKEGYTIRKKRGLFDPGDLSLSSKDKKKVEKIVEFLERGGNTDKWDNYDTLPDFIRKISFDSLTLDQLAFETTRNRMWELDKFKAVDASLVRFLGAVDPRNRQEFEKYRFKGHLPRYCMVWDNQILKNPVTGESIVYYPWELGFGVRNKSTDVYRNGYGVSELETLNEIVTWFLWSLQSNGNSFKNGVFPKGLLNIKGENVSQTTLNEFRQMWYQMMAGPQNAGRIPVLAQSQVEWIDLTKNNKDMEYNLWNQFLIVLICSVYRIDPSELGFQFKESAQMFGQDGQRQRLKHSREKGLKPMLSFLQEIITRYLVSELDESFEFAFTGVDLEDEALKVEIDKKKLEAGMISLEDAFEAYSGRPFNPEKDTILNSVWMNYKINKDNAAAMGGQMNGGEVEGVENEEEQPSSNVAAEEEDPFAKYKSMYGDNPIMDRATEVINKMFGGE